MQMPNKTANRSVKKPCQWQGAQAKPSAAVLFGRGRAAKRVSNRVDYEGCGACEDEGRSSSAARRELKEDYYAE